LSGAITSARETSNATFPPTLKESLVPEMERIGKGIKPERGYERAME
jgi:hypothetical protein